MSLNFLKQTVQVTNDRCLSQLLLEDRPIFLLPSVNTGLSEHVKKCTYNPDVLRTETEVVYVEGTRLGTTDV